MMDCETRQVQRQRLRQRQRQRQRQRLRCVHMKGESGDAMVVLWDCCAGDGGGSGGGGGWTEPKCLQHRDHILREVLPADNARLHRAVDRHEAALAAGGSGDDWPAPELLHVHTLPGGLQELPKHLQTSVHIDLQARNGRLRASQLAAGKQIIPHSNAAAFWYCASSSWHHRGQNYTWPWLCSPAFRAAAFTALLDARLRRLPPDEVAELL